MHGAAVHGLPASASPLQLFVRSKTLIVVCNEADFRSRLYLTQIISAQVISAPKRNAVQYSTVPRERLIRGTVQYRDDFA